MMYYFVVLLFRRSYKFLSLTFLSLLIGGFLFGVVFSFTRSTSSYLVDQGKVLVGGDVVLSSPYPIDVTAKELLALKEDGAVFSMGKSLQAVFSLARSSSTSPSSLRIVSDEFPLYGNVTVSGGDSFAMTSGAVYAEQSFLDRIGAHVGESVVLGDKTFVVKGVLEKEPDGVSLGISFAPKVLMLDKDFDVLSADFSQSRTTYKVFIKESLQTPLTTPQLRSLATYASSKKIRFDDATDGPNSVIRGVSSVNDFIGIVLAVTLFLVVINIGSNLVYVLSRFRKMIALLKIHGATTLQIQGIYSIVLGSIGAIAGVIGSVLGVVATSSILILIEKITGITLFPVSIVYVAPLGGFFGAVFVIISALPFLFAIGKVTPKELLMSQSEKFSSFTIRDVVPYLPIPVLLVGILYGVTHAVLLSVVAVLVCALLFGVSMGIAYLAVVLLYRVRARTSFLLRSIISFLYVRSIRTSITVASIMTALSGVFIVIAVQQNITTNLSANVSKTAPALYLVDVTKSQRTMVEDIVGATYKEYPIVRGRLLAVNNRAITEKDGPELRREFNMTYRDALIDGEKIVDGSFPSAQGVLNPVSIDKKFADDLGGVAIGDTLSLFIQGLTIKATVASVREVDATSGIPFFYLVFSSSTLGSFPASYFATADVGDVERKVIENRIGVLFPNIIPIATGMIIGTVTALLATIVSIVIVVGIPSTVLGILLILVMLWQSLYERSGDVLIMRAFGFERKKVTRLFIIETSLICLFSGVIAYLIAHLVAYVLNIYLFSFTRFSFAVLPLYSIVGIIVIVCFFSYILSYRLSTTSLKKLLAEK